MARVDAIPSAQTTAPASGRFVLRLGRDLHAALRHAAAARGLSLNALCARVLEDHAFGASTGGGCDAVVRHARARFGDALAGVVAFGSWARGDAASSSDLDVLVVLNRGVAVTRDLYRRWDQQPPSCDGRAVDAHVVALPEPDAAVSALWAEVARDGIVLFERDHRVSRHLGRVRRAILTGARRRSTAHGQPYWLPPRPEDAHAQR